MLRTPAVCVIGFGVVSGRDRDRDAAGNPVTYVWSLMMEYDGYGPVHP